MVMDTTIVRLPIDTVMDELQQRLTECGFEVSMVIDLQNTLRKTMDLHFRKYYVLSMFVPAQFHEMLAMSTENPGLVLPCQITVIETYPGETELIPFNPTEILTREMRESSLHVMAREVDEKLNECIRSLRAPHQINPERVTSW